MVDPYLGYSSEPDWGVEHFITMSSYHALWLSPGLWCNYWVVYNFTVYCPTVLHNYKTDSYTSELNLWDESVLSNFKTKMPRSLVCLYILLYIYYCYINWIISSSVPIATEVVLV